MTSGQWTMGAMDKRAALCRPVLSTLALSLTSLHAC